MKILDADRSDFSIYFTRDEMDMCYHSGACDAGTLAMLEYNRAIIETIPIDNARKALQTTGIDDINTMDDDTIYQYILWLAAGNASEQEFSDEFSSYDAITGEFEGSISTY